MASASLPEFGAFGTDRDATFCSARKLVACQLKLRATYGMALFTLESGCLAQLPIGSRVYWETSDNIFRLLRLTATLRIGMMMRMFTKSSPYLALNELK